METEQKNSICDSCANCNCSFQTGIYREKCDFYIPVKELGYAVVGIEHLRKYRQLQNDYEARLKADMVAMLEELKKEIIELPFPQREPEYMQGYSYCQMNILDYVIQDKIDKLRGEEDDTSSIMPDWHIKKIDDERWSVYTKKYVYRGIFNTKSDAYNYIISNSSHKRGAIHVHKKDGAVIEELKFPFRKF